MKKKEKKETLHRKIEKINVRLERQFKLKKQTVFRTKCLANRSSGPNTAGQKGFSSRRMDPHVFVRNEHSSGARLIPSCTRFFFFFFNNKKVFKKRHAHCVVL